MLTALAIGSLLLSPQDPSTAPGEFQTLFNGSSLEGWWGCSWDEHEALHTTNGATLYEVSADELDGEWFVSDGRITSIGSQLHLSTLAEFGDFEFRGGVPIGEGCVRWDLAAR